MRDKINPYSSRITGVKSQGASQAMLYGAGLTDDDMQKAQVGISSVWYEGNPCNMHLNDLAGMVKEGVKSAGLVGPALFGVCIFGGSTLLELREVKRLFMRRNITH